MDPGTNTTLVWALHLLINSHFSNCSFMPFYHASNIPTPVRSGITLRIGISSRTKVEGILPINIYFTSTMDFYSYLLLSTIITQNPLRTPKERELSFRNPFFFYLGILHLLRKSILICLCRACHFQNHWRITNRIHHAHSSGLS